jgi:hypothetical protein
MRVTAHARRRGREGDGDVRAGVTSVLIPSSYMLQPGGKLNPGP